MRSISCREPSFAWNAESMNEVLGAPMDIHPPAVCVSF